ncbi:hypothetical protein COU76_00810 [Candidatus Peregrinibacteria bacterium CG10_big_fil_rev_8_21_14_0_10_49_10]|nr:MAG: hypothetical protein COU76_00810 [Candidatus Peregrinibacteria bacterium CG10_big_fil_rev_8_21_14_0_10_49_10]
MQYVDLELYYNIVFEFIYRYLTNEEPAPHYEEEPDGIEKLKKVLGLVQVDEYYPDFYEKAAYMICSIAGSQYFSNGNKRLAVATLLFFLIENEAEILDTSTDDYKNILEREFESCTWDSNVNIRGEHPLFLYNLAVVIGTRKCWGTNDFSVLKEKVASIFRTIYRI